MITSSLRARRDCSRRRSFTALRARRKARRAKAEKVSLDYAAEAGCGDPTTAAQCLRDLPVGKLHKAPYYFRFGKDLLLTGPITGTDALPVDPISGFANGRAARVPVLIGTNRDEATLFLATWMLQLGESYTAENYPRLLAESFGDNAAEVGERYPLERFDGSAPLAFSAAITDAVFACVTDRMSEDLAKDESVYAYEFNDRDAPAPEPLRQLPFPLGASHTLELRYLFDVGGAPPLNPGQRALSDQMIDYWSHFVTTGSPSAPGPAGVARDWRQPPGWRVLIAAARRQSRRHNLRTRAPVRVLGERERLTVMSTPDPTSYADQMTCVEDPLGSDAR